MKDVLNKDLVKGDKVFYPQGGHTGTVKRCTQGFVWLESRPAPIPCDKVMKLED